MAKGWLVNLGLLAALLAGGGLLWWADQREAAQKATEEASRKVSAIRPDELTRMLFQGKEGEEVTVEKSDKRWRIVAPRSVRTNHAAVERLATLLNLNYERKAADQPADIAAYGLDQPAARLTALAGDGRSLTLLLGGTAPTGNLRYLRLGQEGAVVLLPESKLSPLLQGAGELRDKRLFADMDPAKINAVAIQRQAESLRLTRNEHNRWRIEQPKPDPASDGRVNAWLNMIAVATGSGFQETVPAGPPAWVIQLTVADGSQQEVRIWRDEKHLLAQRQDDADLLLLYAHLVKDFDKPVPELADLRPTGEEEPPTKLTLLLAGKQAAAAKQEGKWPLPAWTTVEETLIREAWQGKPIPAAIQPTLTLTVGEGEAARSYPMWMEDGFYHLAPPGRPVILQLSRLQTEALEAALKVIFPAAEAQAGAPAAETAAAPAPAPVPDKP